MPLNREARRKFERPLPDLHFGRNVHQKGQKNWRDQAHLHNEIQEGAQGDEIAFLPTFFLYRFWGWIKPMTHVLASDFQSAVSLTCVM